MPGYVSSPYVAIDRAPGDDREQSCRLTAPDDADRASAEAWTLFWQEQGASSRCCASAPAGMRDALASHWRSFASTLPAAARVFDLGCGAGAVGRDLVACQPMLRITGIDFAGIPLSADPQVVLLSGTPMESLPFAGSSFDAAVSQFGYEYGRTGQAAREIARVLVPGAPLSFLVHHSESPIVTGCRSHQSALEHLTGAPLETAFLSGDSAALGRQLSRIRRDCAGERIVEQAARGLEGRVRGSEAERTLVWRAVVDALAPELVMARSLKASCVGPDELMGWLAPLAEKFDLLPPSTIRMGGGKPVAWKIEGRRRAEA